MVYRSDTEALAARDGVLARELAAKQRERAEVQCMLEEARAADAADAIASDVMVGRRRLHRLALGLGVLFATVVAAGTLVVTRQQRGDAAALHVPDEITPRDEVAFGLALAMKGLTPVKLEPRFLAGVGGFSSIGEVDAALGVAVAPWQQFTYSRDASARPAVASEVYVAGGPEPEPEFVSDGYGGVWRVSPRGGPRPMAAAIPAHGAARWSRRVWLLPTGSYFGGDVEITYRR